MKAIIYVIALTISNFAFASSLSPVKDGIKELLEDSGNICVVSLYGQYNIVSYTCDKTKKPKDIVTYGFEFRTEQIEILIHEEMEKNYKLISKSRLGGRTPMKVYFTFKKH